MIVIKKSHNYLQTYMKNPIFPNLRNYYFYQYFCLVGFY